MAFYIISERNSVNAVAWGTNYEIEDIIARTCDAQIISPQRRRFKSDRLDFTFQAFFAYRYIPVREFVFADEPNILLLVGMGPRTLRMLDKLGPWRKKCAVVAAYIIDLYPLALKRLNKGILRKLDHLFISYEQMLRPVTEYTTTPVSLVLQASDVLKHGSYGGERPIDIIGYGRQSKDVHDELVKVYNKPNTNKLYFHSTFRHPIIKNWYEDRLLFWKLMRRSKISLCHCFIKTSNNVAFGVSPLTARWFEAIAAGCVIVGHRPQGPEVEKHFNWQNSIIELPQEQKKYIEFLDGIVNDREKREEISINNYYHALKYHDWRYRIKYMLDVLKVPIPLKLTDEITQLEQLSSKTASKLKGLNFSNPIG